MAPEMPAQNKNGSAEERGRTRRQTGERLPEAHSPTRGRIGQRLTPPREPKARSAVVCQVNQTTSEMETRTRVENHPSRHHLFSRIDTLPPRKHRYQAQASWQDRSAKEPKAR